MLQGAVIVLGGIAFADMLCEGAAADWAAVYLRNSLHAVPLVAGLAYAAYALAMLAVRLSGNRLFTRFTAHRVLPLLAAIASLGFAAGLVIARPASMLSGSPCSAPGSEASSRWSSVQPERWATWTPEGRWPRWPAAGGPASSWGLS